MLVKFSHCCAVSVLVGLLATPAVAEFRAGAAAVDVTPQRLPVSMTGAFQDRQATAVHDRLHARALVLDDGTTRLAFVIVDSCLITRDIFDRAKRIASQTTGIPVERMLTAATHTHTAPTAVPLAQCRPDPEYVDRLTRQIARAVEQADASLQPARIAWAAGEEPNELNNRRWFVKDEALRPDPFGRTTDRVRMNPPQGSDVLIRPAGPVDPQVSLLSLQTPEGKPLALLANYGLHYVGSVPPNQLSADYFGEFARQIGQRLGAEDSFVGILSNGASGDVNNVRFLDPRPSAAPFERIQAVAGRVADVCMAARQSAEHRADAKLAMLQRPLTLKIRKPDAVELRRAREVFNQAPDLDRLNTEELYAQESIRLSEGPDEVTILLQAVRIGDTAIVAVPCEVFAAIGLEIRKRSPFPSIFLISLANGYNGYLPTPEQHELGGYETWRSGWSYLEPEASRKITKTLLEMLAELERESL
jgi:neutral ceramidase